MKVSLEFQMVQVKFWMFQKNPHNSAKDLLTAPAVKKKLKKRVEYRNKRQCLDKHTLLEEKKGLSNYSYLSR